MKNTLLPILIFTFAIITACGSQATPQPQPEPATATAAVVSPTATDTSIPQPKNTTPPQAETPTQAAASVSFAKDIMPIFENNCIKCHGVEQIKEGLDLRTYETLMAGSFNGSVITPGNANDSFLVEQIVKGEMPKRRPKLLPEQIQLIIDWINAGALNN